MPGPPNAVNKARRQDASTKETKVDIGKQVGQFDTAGVRHKVRKWQALGGGVVQDGAVPEGEDVIVVEYEEDDEPEPKVRKETPKKSPTKKTDREDDAARRSPTKAESTPPRRRTQKEMDGERKAWVRKKERPHNDLEDELKYAGAPPKRVISDSHWMKDRSSPKKPETTPEKPFTIKRTVVYTENSPTKPKKLADDGIRITPKKHDDNDGIRVTPKKYDDNDGIRVRPMEHVLTGRPNERTHYSPTTRDRPRTPKDSSRPTSKGASSEKDYSGPDRDSDHSGKRNRKPARRNVSPSDAATEITSVAPDDSISKRNGKDGKSPKASQDRVSEKRSSRRLRKSDPSHDRPLEESDRLPPATPPKVYGNRIEAWLTTTPDDADDNVSEAPSKSSSYAETDAGTKTRKFSYETSSPREVKADSKPRMAPRTSRAHVEEESCASSATSSVAPTDIDIPEDRFKKHSPGANLKRHFPSTGHRLSTIVSVESFDTRGTSPAPSETSEGTIVPDDSGVAIGSGIQNSTGSGLKRRLTKHDDLMSVLSLPRADSKSKMSSRSIRTSRTRRENFNTKDLWEELAVDEAKYQRELRTVVDGVIPVLLSCVLSKSDSAVAAGLFGRNAPNDATVTKPIVDMGVALERLKAHHKRIPSKEEPALYTWAQGGTRIYADYLKAWKMGFQDVVVNLAPLSGSNRSGWDDGLLKNEDGDLVNADGERVDVAFLLKRPLVRLKYLAKTFKGFNQVLPSTPANSMADKYQQLVIDARKRSNEERARLEDEAAASIDPKRARDPRSLAPLAGVSIDPTRCVGARDYFDMELRHSSGQQLDCKIEMVMRDDAPGRGGSGDVLFCEISDTGRWLLFPPIRQDLISARKGDHTGEVVVMIRGVQSNGQEWHEVLSLHANEDEAGPEWIQMLGLEPVPPKISRTPSFLTPPTRPAPMQTIPESLKSRSPSPKEIQIPIGEEASSAAKTWDDTVSYVSTDLGSDISRQTGTVHRKPVSNGDKPYNLPNSPLRELYTSIDSALSERAASPDNSSQSGLKRAKAKKYRSSPVSPPLSDTTSSSSYMDHPAPLRPAHSRTQSEVTSLSSESTLSQRKDFSVWLPSSETTHSDDSEEYDSEEDQTEYDGKTDYIAYRPPQTPKRPSTHRRTSSVPSTELPSIPKLRSASQTSPLARSEEVQNPSSAPAKLQKLQKSPPREPVSRTPPESPIPQQKKRFSIPSFTPNFLKRNRRPSSPLKHQYEPSVVSDSESSYSVSSDDANSDDSLTSESSDEAERVLDVKSPGLETVNEFPKPTPPDSVASLAENTLAPSQSASQGPYRTVPQPTGGASKTVASIFSWSDRGAWEPLHAHECTIVVTPGMIEAFELSVLSTMSSEESENASPSTRGFQPIVAFELTPLVPLRRGTALDISIRSPPTINSQIRSSANVMLRSRSAEECENLYTLINLSRINNPTYIALQNARGPFNESTWADAMDRRNSTRNARSSWFPTRKNSTYRSKASRPQSINTDSSVGTTNSTFSALRRFNGGNGIFNIGKSTVTSRQGSRSATSESLSSGSSTPFIMDPSQGTPLGLSNTKIRLHLRETPTKWRDMGSARLTIMLPPRPFPNAPANPRTTGLEKRILIQGKTHGETLLDVTLGESCFERVARTGIAVSVWEDKMGTNGELGHAEASGGVGSSKARTYMLQLKNVSRLLVFPFSRCSFFETRFC